MEPTIQFQSFQPNTHLLDIICEKKKEKKQTNKTIYYFYLRIM